MKLDDKHTMSALLKGNCTHIISKLSTMPIEKSIGTLELSVFIKTIWGYLFFKKQFFKRIVILFNRTYTKLHY